MTDYPFPFFGAGDATYYLWAEIHVRFVREPTEREREAIEGTIPVPLRETVDWSEPRQVVAASGLCLQGALSRTYPAKPGDEDFLGPDGWFHAAPSRVEGFNDDIESWLRHAHRRCPILVAYRGTDGDDTRLSDWHDWSVRRLPRLMPELESILAEAIATRRQTAATHMTRGILALARRAGRPDRRGGLGEAGDATGPHLIS